MAAFSKPWGACPLSQGPWYCLAEGVVAAEDGHGEAAVAALLVGNWGESAANVEGVWVVRWGVKRKHLGKNAAQNIL